MEKNIEYKYTFYNCRQLKREKYEKHLIDIFYKFRKLKGTSLPSPLEHPFIHKEFYSKVFTL